MYKIYKISKIITLVIFFLVGFISNVSSDIIYLKNDRSIEGIITRETEEIIELDLGIGVVTFTREEIKNIKRSSPDKAAVMRQEWQRQRELEKKAEVENKAKKETEPKEVTFSRTFDGMVVNALLNNKVKALLVIDTGAATTAISPRIAKELGMGPAELENKPLEKHMVVDSRLEWSRPIILDSVNVEGVEVMNVEAAVLLKEVPFDGLLGMSFLNKFDFQIDTVNKKIILKKLNTQSILEKTKYFSVICPFGWERKEDKEGLVLFAPPIPKVESKLSKPYIMISKDTNESEGGFSKVMKKWYNYWKGSPDIKRKMSELLESSYKKSSSEVEFISSDYEEKQDTMMFTVVYLSRKSNERICDVMIVKKNEPVKGYRLLFVCIDSHFDEYLPVFNKCVESFTIIE